MEIEFMSNPCNNYGFAAIYHGIFKKLIELYPDISIKKNEIFDDTPITPTSPRSSFNFTIINPKNRKTIILSFWDRVIDVINGMNPEWDNYNIVHLIGGLGVYLTEKEIMEKFNIKFTPFFYPLGLSSCYETIEKIYEPYDYNKKSNFYRRSLSTKKTIR